MNKLIIVAALLFSQLGFAKTTLPTTVSDLKETSVRIMNLEKTSGGTGSILKSFSNATHILTNKHVCRLIEPGGVVNYKNKNFLISHYKKFDQHDLCLVRIEVGLNIDTQVSNVLAKESDKAVVSGHPSLLPHIVTVGHLSERQDIQLIVGIMKCTKEDMKIDPLTCIMFGGAPVVKTLDAQLVSNLIKPGNSGSAVFNKTGEIIGVVFAGSGREFSYGYIVPQIYLIYFLQNAHRFDWVKVGTPVDDEGMSDRVFNYEKCQQVKFKTDEKYDKVKELCDNISDTMIWSK